LNKQGQPIIAPGNTEMDNMQYLFAAYMAIWIILSVYLFSLHSREKKLRKEIQRLKSMLKNSRQ
jgi:CcmD family protein